MHANELRRAFTDFFVQRGHTAVPSANLIPHDDSLLFVNSGMVQFKPYFQGELPAPYPRAVSIQKCVRAGGKHNDLEEVGRTSRHLTFFEMMGNFSFGDYFKEDACAWAWELSTEVLGLDPERLWATVHHTDDEGADIWRDRVGLPAERIQRLGDEDNWWRMADTGPNGPCSELHYDRGPEFGDDGGPLADPGGERFFEYWNLVFMQFDQAADGTQTPLPRPSIDTGAGLERIVSILQDVDSVWETSEFVQLLRSAGAATGVQPGTSPQQDVSLRILADHARSSAFLISDGVYPSNEDRGYVLRRIMRRAIRHAYLLGVTDVVTPSIIETVVEIMGPDYPGLVQNQSVVYEVAEREEVRFRETLRTGSAILDAELEEAGHERLSGSVAFRLHDTYGFPLEVTQEIARERGVDVDTEAFDVEMAAQRQRAKAARHDAIAQADGEEFAGLLARHGDTEFVGRDHEGIDDATVLAVVEAGEAGVVIVLDRTPFYAESGGQIGDTGTIVGPNGRAEVADTTYVAPGLHGHHARIFDGEIAAGDAVSAAIDGERRARIRRNHTATHLLHWALRAVLGDHVKQQGSYVGPDHLRFDFSHFDALEPEQIAAVEDLANAEILGNEGVDHFETTMAEAQEMGAIAFFGDKYGDQVRVLRAGPHSIELCGGTHVGALGDIGPVKIVSESSIGSNLRRIEAISGTGPIERLRAEEATIDHAASLLGVPVDDMVGAIQRRAAEIKELRSEMKALRRSVALGASRSLAAEAVDGAVVARVDDIDRGDLRELAVAVRDLDGVDVVVLGGAPSGGGVALVAAVSEASGRHASDLLAEPASMVGGGGGKDPLLAMAGGKDRDAIDAALDQVREQLDLTG